MPSLFRRRHQPSPASTSPDPITASSVAGPSTQASSKDKMGLMKRRKSLGDMLSPNFYSRSPSTEQLDPLLTADYVMPEHIDAFREALSQDLGQQEYNAASASASSQLQGSSSWNVFGYGNSLKSPDPTQLSQQLDPKSPRVTEPSSTQVENPRKIGRIAAASDFAPIREKISKKGRKKRGSVDSGTREGFVFHTLRWPLLMCVFIVISLEFLAYVLVRQLVNVIEFSLAWRGKKGQLRKKMRSATTYPSWKEAALAQDEFMGYEKWKTEDGSGFYDWILVKKVKASLKSFREKDDVNNLLGVLDLCLRNNFAGTENFRLYSETYLGTKYLVEGYLAEVETALNYIENTDKVSLEVKRTFYRTVSKNLGRSALCLSGGASFGYYHIGVVRALLDSDLLPKVVTGTSAGGLIAALTCTRTDAELKSMLVPALADRITACEEPFSVWGRRAWNTGARFDTVQWAEKCSFFTRGSMTFKEAYEKTGKVLCISVIPADRHSPVKLLNYATAPDCVIWSALLASAAVPGIMNPVCLMQREKGTDQIIPWNWGHRFKDGSLRVDIPLQDLHALFNVNYPIVSQVNPHVHLFHFGSKGSPGRPTAHRKGKGWRGGFILSACERILKLHLKMNFKILRDLDLLPAILGQDWSSVFLQRFGGAVTILPKTRAWDWVRLLSDPDRKELDRMIRVGASVTFPKIHMIENRVRLEKAIEQGRKVSRRAARLNASTKSATNSAAHTPSGLAMSYTASGANSQSATRNGETGSSGGEGAGAEKIKRFAAAPSSAGGSLASDTDVDDFFSSRVVASHRGLSKIVGLTSGAATPSSIAATPNEEQRPAQVGKPERPKPYPSYSRYLVEKHMHKLGTDAGESRKSDVEGLGTSNHGSDRQWLNRESSEIEAEDEGEATQRGPNSGEAYRRQEATSPAFSTQQPFYSATSSSHGASQVHLRAPSPHRATSADTVALDHEGEIFDPKLPNETESQWRRRTSFQTAPPSSASPALMHNKVKSWRREAERNRTRKLSWDDRSQDFDHDDEDDELNASRVLQDFSSSGSSGSSIE